MVAQIQVLDSSGHLTLEWDPGDEQEVLRARAEVERLAQAGYSFFVTETDPADAVAAGRGKLLVKLVTDPVSELSQPDAQQSEAQLLHEATSTDGSASSPRRRGRPPREAVAVRRQAGG